MAIHKALDRRRRRPNPKVSSRDLFPGPTRLSFRRSVDWAPATSAGGDTCCLRSRQTCLRVLRAFRFPPAPGGGSRNSSLRRISRGGGGGMAIHKALDRRRRRPHPQMSSRDLFPGPTRFSFCRSVDWAPATSAGVTLVVCEADKRASAFSAPPASHPPLGAGREIRACEGFLGAGEAVILTPSPAHRAPATRKARPSAPCSTWSTPRDNASTAPRLPCSRARPSPAGCSAAR